MKNFKLKVLTLLLFCVSFGLHAQQSTVSTGGAATGSGGSVSYSIGQVVYTTNTGTTGSVAQGVQQAYEISVVTGILETGIGLKMSVYPNPTSDYVTLEVKDFELSSMNFQLYDIQGKLLQSNKLTGSETQINMSTYISATYFVRIISENKSIKEFKIIKN